MSRIPRPLNNRRRHIFAGLGLLAGFLAASASIVTTSSAAFTATTDNVADSWTVGAIALTDDDSAQKLFNVTGMVPGQTVVNCIEVTYTGNASSVTPIKLYSSLNSQTQDLANYLKVKVEEGTGATFGDCSSFSPTATIVNNETLSTLTSTRTDFSSGAGTFTPTSSPATVSYRFSVTLDAATPNSAQGATAAATFTWEIQSA